MVLDQIASGIRKCINIYRTNTAVRTATNTIAITASIYFAGEAVRSQDLELILHASAPMVGGVYLNGVVNDPDLCKSESVRTVVKVGAAAVTGAIIGDAIICYRGDWQVFESLKASYHTLEHMMARSIGGTSNSPGYHGAILGGTLGVVGRIAHYYRKNK